MSWFLRLKEDAELYKPRVCPVYTDPDYFTIILYHGGEMQLNPKKYVNGIVDYVDNCNGDEMSLIEIGSMLKEVDDCGGFHTYSYKLPNTDMERGCFDLETDEDVLIMCQLIANRDSKLDRYVEIFVERMKPISSSQVEMNTCRKWDLTGLPCYHACACIALRNEPWDMYIHDCYKKDNYLQLYSHTLEPIVGPEFWEDTPEPNPLPPNVRIPTGRPKKKRNNKNDVPKDPTKLRRQNTKVHCTYCKAVDHNQRSCPARKSDEVTKAAAEGRTIVVGKSKVTCKTCNQLGHNSRTCKVKKTKEGAQGANEGPNEGGATNGAHGESANAHGESANATNGAHEGTSTHMPNAGNAQKKGTKRPNQPEHTSLRTLKAAHRAKKKVAKKAA